MTNYNLNTKMKLSNFKIELHDKNGVYYPGQQVTGALIVHVEKPFETTGITIRFLGSCYVSDSKRQTHNDENEYRQHYDSLRNKEQLTVNKKTDQDVKSTNKYYKDTEVYFDVWQKLWGKESTEEIDIGYHTIPFALTLPGKLPTSLETDRGYVRYTIMATIGRARKHDIRIQRIITVISVVDLNAIKNLEKFVNKEENINFGSTLNKKGTVNISVTINKSGYVPGEEIVFNASILNNTKKSIAHSAVAILCVISYHKNGFVKQETKEVCRRMQDAIPPNESGEWTNERMPISSIPPTGFGESFLIHPEYCVVFTCKSGYGDIEVVLPIVIGTIPLQNNFSTFRAEESLPASNLSKVNYDKIPFKPKIEAEIAKQTKNKKPPKIAVSMVDKVSDKTAQAHWETLHAFEAINMCVKYTDSNKTPPSYEDSVHPTSKPKQKKINKMQAE